ncbi:N-lysine methyltransferase SMYD2 [Podospora fimiseda]|uniref:N-lysine methyltransferase SMYD2 n=1 Tax=Podospora fimiseda TaxID=252190 RepID=A0AAN7BJV1_9PEZI|nr:N-lysine methyltransferase SMYD2 [Podospora fimiseda]
MLSSSLFVVFLLLKKSQALQQQQCINNPEGPLLPLLSSNQRTCPPLVDDESSVITGTWAPWEHSPVCFEAKATAASTRKKKLKYKASSKLCVYTTHNTWAGGALSLVTTPIVAANVASILFDPGMPGLERERGNRPFKAADPRPYEVKEINGKGLGVVATRRIKIGEVVMVEMPALLSTLRRVDEWESKDFLRLLKGAAEGLPEEKREELLKCARGGKGYVVYDVLNTNSFQVGVGAGVGRGIEHSGLFIGIARINHACKPNCFTRFSPSTLLMEVVAYRDIQPGEEIFISYAPLNILSKDRRKFLQLWGFNCTCSLCADPVASRHSDHQRARVQELLEELDNPKARTPEKVLNNLRDIEGLAEKEGMTAQIGDLYGIVANIFVEMGEMKLARKYANVAVKNLKWYAGFDSERAVGAIESRERIDGKSGNLKKTARRREATDSDLGLLGPEE